MTETLYSNELQNIGEYSDRMKDTQSDEVTETTTQRCRGDDNVMRELGIPDDKAADVDDAIVYTVMYTRSTAMKEVFITMTPCT